jgi:glycosyltransferase involved in cell wall biosynthesis
VLDERLDFDLVRALAQNRPAWSIVLVGPVVKIEQSDIPSLPNVHWLGAKPYAELPSYLGGWDVAIMPFARNEATEYISPTKTPEYLAGGRPVVSTSIRDVVEPYGENGLARIADTPDASIAAIDSALAEDRDAATAAADAFLAHVSWDRTWRDMDTLATRAARGPLAVVERLIGATKSTTPLPLAPARATTSVATIATRQRIVE